MRRREFLGLVGSAAAVWPLAAHAQQAGQIRRIGVLMNKAANDPEGQARLTAFQQAMQQLGWTDGSNVQIDVCWGADDVDRERKCATDLVARKPSIFFASGTLT